MKKNKILIITGGTGGHVIPAINFFNYLQNNSENVFLLTDKRGYNYVTNTNKKNIWAALPVEKKLPELLIGKNSINKLNINK